MADYKLREFPLALDRVSAVPVTPQASFLGVSRGSGKDKKDGDVNRADVAYLYVSEPDPATADLGGNYAQFTPVRQGEVAVGEFVDVVQFPGEAVAFYVA
jgi:hypothetical protein